MKDNTPEDLQVVLASEHPNYQSKSGRIEATIKDFTIHNGFECQPEYQQQYLDEECFTNSANLDIALVEMNMEIVNRLGISSQMMVCS